VAALVVGSEVGGLPLESHSEEGGATAMTGPLFVEGEAFFYLHMSFLYIV